MIIRLILRQDIKHWTGNEYKTKYKQENQILPDHESPEKHKDYWDKQVKQQFESDGPQSPIDKLITIADKNSGK
jgi:hypothetical protein